MASSNKVHKRALIIHPEGNTFSNPSLKCIVDLLIEKGFTVDIRHCISPSVMPDREGIRYFPYGKIYRKVKSFVFDRWINRVLMYISVAWENTVHYKNNDVIIAVDRLGLIEAYILNKLTKTPYIFISFEIMFAEETSREFKGIEKTASKNIKGWVAQDSDRANALVIENGLSVSNLFTLPLASSKNGTLQTKRLRDILGINPDKKVAIAIGSMEDWTMINEVLASVGKWPDDWCLIIHDRYGDTGNTLKKSGIDITQMINKKIFISNKSADAVDDLGAILSGVDVGLTFYKPLYTSPFVGKNLEILGLASGKISTHLRYGIPVIMNNIGMYAAEATKHKFGLVIDHPDSLADCLAVGIPEDTSQHAIDYFSRILDFDNYKEELYNRLFST